MNAHATTDQSLSAREIAEQAEFGLRQLKGAAAWLIPVIAAAWSLFQLALPKWLTLNSDLVRCIHLCFAMVLVFLSFPALNAGGRLAGALQKRGRLGFLYRGDTFPFFDLLLAVIGGLAALYYALDYEAISGRMGAPLTRDLVAGALLVVLLLEAARRGLGLALPVIAGCFILFSMFSQHMPDFIAFKNASFEKVIGKLALGTEGIYGVPLDVSASTVFLFVLFGAILDRAGGGRFFIDLAMSMLGWLKGGPAKAAVVASGLTGMVSGSSIANTVTTGTFTIPLMKRGGYPAVKAGAVEVAASTNGQLMPPIMGAAAFIIAEYCGLAYMEVIKAAFIPAVISYLALIYITHLEASKLRLKGIPRHELPAWRRILLSGCHHFIPLFFLIYMLAYEQRSPNLSAFYAILVLMGLIVVEGLVYAARGKLSYQTALKQSALAIWDGLVAGGRNMMSIGVAVAAAGIIAGIVTLGLSTAITDIIELLSGGNIYALLVITAIVSLILGMGLPTTANYIVMASLTVPAIITLAGDIGLAVPLIAAHLFCFYFGILADDTPPVGLAAYAAAVISKADPIKTGIQGFIYDIRTAILPFMFIFNTDLLLIGITSWWQIGVVFATGLIAMFAFAAATQGWLIARNRFYETLLLLVVTVILLRPMLLGDWLGVERGWVYVSGCMVYAAVFALQWPRAQKAVDPPLSALKTTG